MGVALDDDHIVVRGLLNSRSIPIPLVTSITNFPAVKWKSKSGRSRWTHISALMARRAQHRRLRQGDVGIAE